MNRCVAYSAAKMKEIYEINNFVNLSIDLNKPLNKTQRIKYTCYDASCNYIVCGATSGSLYLFQRQQHCKFLQLIPNTNGAINNVAISPQEQYIAFTTQKGTVCVYAIDLTTVQPVVCSAYYREMTVTHLKWKQNECQLFLGNMKGNVFLANLNNFLGRNLTNISIHPILFLETPVVQISELEQLLLVSNYTKCILCNTDTEEFKQIGNQPRNGNFGACFLFDNHGNNESRLQAARIICARPGSRMWECNVDGQVLQTHKFKSILSTKSATDIRGYVDDNTTNDTLHSKHQCNEQLVNLQPINEFYVLGYTQTAFYIFDLIHSNIVLWNNSFDPIHTIKVIENDSSNTLIIFTKDYKMFSLQLMQLDRIFYDRITKELYFDSCGFLLQNLKYFKEKADDLTFRYYYSILLNKIACDDNDDENRLQQLHNEFDELLSKKYDKQYDDAENDVMINGRRLSNGIYLIENSFAPNHDTRSDPIKTMKNMCDDNDDETLSILSSVDDDNIVHSNAKTANATPYQNSVSLVIEPKVLTEHNKVVQNLFFIYKSLKMSNFNLVERYADIFDSYDLSGIQRLLNALESMICENDSGISPIEVKQYCARMYLNYIKIESLDDLDADTRDFIVECFVRANGGSGNHNNDTIQRCQSCNFPLVVEVTVFKYREFAEIIVKYLLSHDVERNRLWDIVERVPASLNIMVKRTIENQFDTPSKTSHVDFDAIIDLLFACANQVQLEHFVKKYASLRTFDFWRGFLTRLIRLHDERTIQCVRCCTTCAICYQKLAESKPFYAHDYVLNVCADHLNGLTALQLCTNIAKNIPSDAISKKFYLKCLLNS